MKKAAIPLFTAFLTIGIALTIALKNNNSHKEHKQQHPTTQTDRPQNETRQDRPSAPPSDQPGRETGFNRRTAKLIFTKHARCRMGCRHIEEAEVKDILENGTINERKSEPAARPDPKYALEGRTRDGQQVRIIFAPTNRGMVVITVIDLDTNWTCNCK